MRALRIIDSLPNDTELSLAHTNADNASTPVAVNETVTAAALGDRQAFERVYRDHVGRVFALCARMLGDHGLAEEATQDVFVRVWQKLPGFRGESAFSTWLHRVAVNVILTRRKSTALQQSRTTDDDGEIDIHPDRPVHVGDRMDLARDHLSLVFHRFLSPPLGMRAVTMSINRNPLSADWTP